MSHRFVLGIVSAVLCTLLSGQYAGADECSDVRSQVNQLKAKLQQAEHDADLVNDPQHPEKEAGALARVHALQQELQKAQGKLGVCQHPTPPLLAGTRKASPPPTVDPQIAVGKTLVAAVDSSHVNFYNKSGLTPVSTGNIAAPINVFQDVQLAINQKIHAKPGAMGQLCDPTHPKRYFDAQNNLVRTSTCIYEFYDTRAYYDVGRGRFWIVSGARNRLWPCQTADGKEGATNGYDVEPDPKDSSKGLCRPELAGMARRYDAVAVSKSGEDLSQGFYTYIVVSTYADWPQFTVNGSYLMLNHRAGHVVHVFDAALLAAGTKDKSVLEIEPLLNITDDDFDPKPRTPVTPVNHHGNTDRVTNLVAGTADGLAIYGLSAPAENPSAKPVIMKSATVPLPEKLSKDGGRSNGVYFHGKVYFASHMCTSSHVNHGEKWCSDYNVDVVRVPVERSGDSNKLQTAGASAEFTLGNVLFAAAVPAIEVTENEDMVVVFSGGLLEKRKPLGAHYAVIYHDLSTPSSSALLQDAVGIKPAGDPAEGGTIDLGGAALDPVPDPSEGNKRVKVWMSHAYSNNGDYAYVLGAMKP